MTFSNPGNVPSAAGASPLICARVWFNNGISVLRTPVSMAACVIAAAHGTSDCNPVADCASRRGSVVELLLFVEGVCLCGAVICGSPGWPSSS